MEETPAPELFISHASEDKDPFVRALANALMSFGVRVWYDEFELKLGDSLSRSIDEGLSRTAFGLVVLSKSFFAKRWTEYELRGLTAREVAAEGKVILPVWLGVTKEDVLKFSPPLADKYAVVANRDGDVRSVARKIIEVVAPHRYSTFRAIDYALEEDGLGTAEPQDEPLSSPPRNLPMQGWSFVRANLVFACLPDIFPSKAGNSFDAFMSDLSREVSPELEIRAMEAIASAYHWTRRRVVVPPDKERPLLGLLMNLSVGRTPSPELLDLRTSRMWHKKNSAECRNSLLWTKSLSRHAFPSFHGLIRKGSERPRPSLRCVRSRWRPPRLKPSKIHVSAQSIWTPSSRRWQM